MNRKFTDTWLQNYRPVKARDEIFETGKDGFGVRVTGTCKAFFFRRRIKGNLKRFSLGKYPETTLAQAHVKAAKIKEVIDGGGDPQEAYRIRRPKTDPVESDAFESVVKRFMAEYCRGKQPPLRGRTMEGYEWALQGDLTGEWNRLPLPQITRKMIREKIRKLEADGRFASARLLRAYLSKFFNWAVGEELAETNPTLGITLKSKPQKRNRHLSLTELRDVLSASDKLEDPYRTYLWTLILTGQRRGETSKMKWSDLSLAAENPTWFIPADNAKNKREHSVPLSILLVELLQRVKKLGEFVFTTDGTTHLAGFSKLKIALDKKLAELKPDTVLKPWCIHDLRRSFSTRLNDHKILPHVVDAILNHVSGDAKKGVSGTYNLSPYEVESRHALETWAQLLTSKPPSSNVVALRG